jgi:hypothetical protein
MFALLGKCELMILQKFALKAQSYGEAKDR